MAHEWDEGDRQRSTIAVVDLSAIGDSIRSIRDRIGRSRHLMAVVKADGYGHGAVPVARTALRHGADWLGVALPEEGVELREAGITARILVFGLIRPEEASKSANVGLDQAVASLPLIEALDQAGQEAGAPIHVHLKIDTGMGRIGVAPDEAVRFAQEIVRRPGIRLAGVFSHLATADHEDKSYARRQLSRFEEALAIIERAGIDPGVRHIANSAAILDLPESYYDLVRPGIMIYGLYPSPSVGRTIPLRPAMEFRTRISAVKAVPSGTAISYGCTHVTTGERTVIATLPVGYADGYRRSLSDNAEVLVRGQRAPIVGTVCMDMCMIDVTSVPDVKVHDPVVLFGRNPTADEIAKRLGTINYEVTCAVTKRVPRVYRAEEGHG